MALRNFISFYSTKFLSRFAVSEFHRDCGESPKILLRAFEGPMVFFQTVCNEFPKSVQFERAPVVRFRRACCELPNILLRAFKTSAVSFQIRPDEFLMRA